MKEKRDGGLAGRQYRVLSVFVAFPLAAVAALSALLLFALALEVCLWIVGAEAMLRVSQHAEEEQTFSNQRRLSAAPILDAVLVDN